MELAHQLIDYDSLMDEEERKWMNEPHIRWNANGGTDMWGEWNFSGSWRGEVPKGEFGNIHSYECNRSIHYTKRYKRSGYSWSVHLGDDYPRHKIGSGKAKSKKEVKEKILKAIAAYEASDHFQTVIWPEVVSWSNRKPIFKKIGDQIYWIATLIGPGTDLYDIFRWKNPFDKSYLSDNFVGHGKFYSQRVRIEWDHKFGEKDELFTIIVSKIKDIQESWRQLDGSPGSYGSSGIDHKDKEEVMAKLSEAFFDVNNMAAVYIQIQRYDRIDDVKYAYLKK